MILYIPLADGQAIPHQVLESICKQTITMHVVPVVSEGLLKSNHTDLGENHLHAVKTWTECKGRNKIKNFLNVYRGDFFAMQDSDALIKFDWCYEKALKKIIDEELNAVTLSKAINRDHWDIIAGVYRTEIFKNYDFRFDKYLHICSCVKLDLGDSIQMLDDKIITAEEITRPWE